MSQQKLGECYKFISVQTDYRETRQTVEHVINCNEQCTGTKTGSYPSARSPRQEWENLAHFVTFCEDDSWPVSSTMWLLLW